MSMFLLDSHMIRADNIDDIADKDVSVDNDSSKDEREHEENLALVVERVVRIEIIMQMLRLMEISFLMKICLTLLVVP